MYAHEKLLFCCLIAIIISVLHVIGHTRKEENLGLTELVRSFHIGRQANSLATMVETILINVLLALFTRAVLISFSAETMTTEGSHANRTSLELHWFSYHYKFGRHIIVCRQCWRHSNCSNGISISNRF